MTTWLCLSIEFQIKIKKTLSLAVFSFLIKISNFVLAQKARIILHFCHLRTNFFQENENANLTFAMNAILDLFIISWVGS